MRRKLILYISCSLDGFISKPNDDLSFLTLVNQEGEDYGYHNFEESTDTVIIGRKTYDFIMQHVDIFPHVNKRTFVVTKTKKEKIGNIIFYTGNLKELIIKLKAEEGKNIHCDGGSQLVNNILKHDLFDELIISIIPILLGDGIKLFEIGIPEKQLTLISTESFKSGLVQLHYKL
jgi:dihydrofolate reductase